MSLMSIIYDLVNNSLIWVSNVFFVTHVCKAINTMNCTDDDMYNNTIRCYKGKPYKTGDNCLLNRSQINTL